MRKIILIFCWFWAAWLWGQSGEVASKCAPLLRLGETGEVFAVVVSDATAFEQQLSAIAPQARVLHRYAPAGAMVLRCPPEIFWKRVLPLPEVHFADRGQLTGQPERAVPGHDLSVDDIRAVHVQHPTLDGRGTVVSIKEWRFDSTDVDLRGRVLLSGLSAPQTTVHATLMATLAAGAGNSDSRGRGVARGAQVLSSSFLGLLPDTDEEYEAWNVGVQNHAYGTDIENYYGAGALAYDVSAQRHPGLLHVFSAGNLGEAAAPGGTYQGLSGWANLTGQYKMAKNALVVGATDTTGQVQSFSGRGPAYDGRVKPDMVAYGPNGTSEAAALVSGAAAIVRQCLQEQRGLLPTSDAVRAVLLAACDELGTPGPDFVSGFGSLNLRRAVSAAQRHPLWQGALAQGEQVDYTFDVVVGAHELRAVLCWNDPPAAPLAPFARVNDLDAVLIGPAGQVWLPWVLQPYPNADSLRRPAQRGTDTLNTVELISLKTPPPGSYTLRVSARAVANGLQPFTVAVHLDTAGRFAWKTPLTGERAVRAGELTLRWHHTRPETHGALSWRRLPDGPWVPLADSISLNTGRWSWRLPDMTTAAQVRMSIDQGEWLSDTFLIAPALRLSVDVNCPDSLLVHWNTAAPDAQYRLWGLGARYLEALLLTTDTALVLSKTLFPQSRFAVSALLNAAETPPSAAPDIAEQGADCYLNAFWAVLDETRGSITLTLALGSLYGVERVFWEKKYLDGWLAWHEQAAEGLLLQAEDSPMQPGKHTYRVRVRMSNGTWLTSDEVSVYYAGATGAHVYPNPALPAQVITVLAAADQLPAQWQLFDAMGRLVALHAVEDELAEMRLPHLPPGLYAWRLLTKGQQVTCSTLIVRP